MSLFFGYLVTWFNTLLSWLWSNVLSLQVLNVPLWGWMLGMIVLSGALSLILRFRVNTPNVLDNGSSIARSSRRLNRKG